MHGYSSYDNYFGISNGRPYSITPYAGGINGMPTQMRPLPPDGYQRRHHKKDNTTGVVGTVAGLAAVAGGIALAIKGKGKLSEVFSKVKTAGLKETASKIGSKITDSKVAQSIKKIFSKGAKEAAPELAEEVASEAAKTASSVGKKLDIVSEAAEKFTDGAGI